MIKKEVKFILENIVEQTEPNQYSYLNLILILLNLPGGFASLRLLLLVLTALFFQEKVP